MTLKTSSFRLFFLAGALLIAGNVFTNSSGVTTALSGSPLSSGQTCASCHSGGSSALQTVEISSDIPPSGFLPNTNYTIKIKARGNGGVATKGGFNATVEHQSVFAGSLTTLTGGGAQIVGNVATHRNTSNTFTNDSLVWKFNWNSGSIPSATIYAAVNFANGNNTTTGDAVKTSSLQLVKSVLGLPEQTLLEAKVYPNPTSDHVTISAFLLQSGPLTIAAYDVFGRKTATIYDGYAQAGIFEITTNVAQLPAGTYFITTNISGRVHSQPLIIK